LPKNRRLPRDEVIRLQKDAGQDLLSANRDRLTRCSNRIIGASLIGIRHLLDKDWEGSLGVDATFTATYARGTRADAPYTPADPDAGWYIRDGDHAHPTPPPHQQSTAAARAGAAEPAPNADPRKVSDTTPLWVSGATPATQRPPAPTAAVTPSRSLCWSQASNSTSPATTLPDPQLRPTIARIVTGRSLWVPNTVSPHATWAYSWRNPPSRSRRMTLMSASTGLGSARNGLAWFRARCGR
jgi:hypothetical protein